MTLLIGAKRQHYGAQIRRLVHYAPVIEDFLAADLT
jgi:hypothetical protein